MKADLVLAGGGLANCLIALEVAANRPDIDMLLLERGPALGGNHTWCFHRDDVTAAQMRRLEPLLAARWTGYEIRFPERRRILAGGYHAILSDNLHVATVDALGDRVICNAEIDALDAGSVTLRDGRRILGRCVIDGRGAAATRALWVCYQKFVGQVIDLERPHGLDLPVLMDATVEQRDGFRFIYVLPLASTRLLVEDTRYSNGADLAHIEMREAIERYVSRAGWTASAVVREEEGVLPVVLGGDIERFWPADDAVPRSGLRAGLFNYTTGYSLPEAMRCAGLVAGLPELTSSAAFRALRGHALSLWRRGRFLRLLNRMLFLAGQPSQRYRVMQHFYRLPEPTIGRFYAGRPTLPDRLRILSGRPPVPVASAFRAMFARHRA